MPEILPQKLDGYHWHEALDRTCICMEMVDRYILFHPAIESNETLKAKQKKHTSYCLKFARNLVE